MTIIALPTVPGIVTAQPELMDLGVQVPGISGGSVITVRRPGARYRMAINYPIMAYDPTGRDLLSLLRQARYNDARIRFPQDFTIPPMGAVRVAGAGQTGMSINLDGFHPYVVIRQGQFFNVTTGGVTCLYCAASTVVVSGTGTATVTMETPLRKIPADNDVCDFDAPVIEGLIDGESFPWGVNTEPHVTIPTFTISER